VIGLPDTIDGRFEIEGEVTRGGMARLLRARDRHAGGHVAIKLSLSSDAESAERFGREAGVLAELRHPGIVPYVAHGTLPDGQRWLAMQWLDGMDLSAKLRTAREASRDAPTRDSRSGPSTIDDAHCLSIREALKLGMRIASGLGEIHRRGIVHRDVKPGNIFLRNGSVDDAVLVDFGTARSVAPSSVVTMAGTLVGTPSYMSPEQASAAADIGAPTDVWSLGCVLYYALTAHNPFDGGHLLAVLARIVIDEPLPLRTLRADVPEPLARLVTRMLAKDPRARLRDGDAVLAELRAIESVGDAESGVHVVSRALAAREQRVRSIVVARGSSNVESRFEPFREAASRAGATLHRVADGSLVLTLPPEASSTDQARRAAAAALALRALDPKMRLALASTQMEAATEPPGEVVDRAARTLDEALPGEARVDTLTAELVDVHFVVAEGARGKTLERARENDAGRTLLGRPTPLVGRRRELTTARALWDECVDEPIARALLVLGDAGMGKSRLRRELTRAIVSQESGNVEVLFGPADSLGAGSPFVMTTPLVRSAAEITDTDGLDARRAKLHARVARTVTAGPEALRIAAFLGEMIGTSFVETDVPELAAARRDPLLMNAAMTSAWVDWLRAETSLHPVLLVLEDLHWGDLVSVKLVDAALQRLAGAPLFVLALARPEVKASFPQLFASSGLVELRLDALSRKASRDLVREVLGSETSDEDVERIVERSGGNAFFLEELIRTVAGGQSDTLPDTVLGIVQSRLDALGDDVKRVLRTASIFGEVFTVEGVEALVGRDAGPFGLREWLDDLVAREVIGHHTGGGRTGELKFRHALVRDAAYAMLTEQDRAWGHRLAAEWLESSGNAEPLLLAEQFMRGDLPARAVRWFRRAAEQALDGRDLDAVRRHAQRAIDAGASNGDLAAAYHLQAVASYWQSGYADAQRQATSAARLFREGTSEWFRAVAEAVVSSARLGDYATLDRWFERAASADAGPGAEGAQLVCLCRGTFQMIFAGRFAASDKMLERIGSLSSPSRASVMLDDLTRAQVAHVQGLRAAHAGDVATFLARLETVVEAFERTGDRNNVRLERTTIGWCWAEIGDFERAEAIVRENMAECIRAGAQQAITYANVNLGYILTHRPGRRDEARSLLGSAIEECRAVRNSRLEGWARAHASALEHAHGDHETSLEHAVHAVRLLSAAPSLHGWALATRARALLAVGRAADALDDALEAKAKLESLGGLLQGESLPPLVLAEVLAALERADEATAAANDARRRVERRAERLGRPEWRAFFLAVPDNARTLELGRA